MQIATKSSATGWVKSIRSRSPGSARIALGVAQVGSTTLVCRCPVSSAFACTWTIGPLSTTPPEHQGWPTGDLMHVPADGMPGADVNELPYPGLGGQEPDRPLQERPVGTAIARTSGNRAAPAGRRRVNRIIVLASQVSVIHPGRMRPGRVNLRRGKTRLHDILPHRGHDRSKRAPAPGGREGDNRASQGHCSQPKTAMMSTFRSWQRTIATHARGGKAVIPCRFASTSATADSYPRVRGSSPGGAPILTGVSSPQVIFYVPDLSPCLLHVLLAPHDPSNPGLVKNGPSGTGCGARALEPRRSRTAGAVLDSLDQWSRPFCRHRSALGVPHSDAVTLSETCCTGTRMADTSVR